MGEYLQTGAPGHTFESHPITDAVGGPKNGFSLNSDPMTKMCFHCTLLHRDIRSGATPEDASLCPKCEAAGIAEPARYTADGRDDAPAA